MKNVTHSENRKINYEYFINETYICGIVLTGPEVKMIRKGMVSISESYCYFKDGELFIKNSTIQGVGNVNTQRERKLLMKKRELQNLEFNLTKGLTILPYKIFTNEKGIIKVKIVLAKGKKLYDKRLSIKEKEIKKDLGKL